MEEMDNCMNLHNFLENTENKNLIPNIQVAIENLLVNLEKINFFCAWRLF